MKSRKIISMILCFLLMATLFVGCSKDTGSKEAKSDQPAAGDSASKGDTKDEAKDEPAPVEINIGFWPAEDKENELAKYDEYKRICEEKYPYITVIPAHYDYDESTFLPMALAGETPTVFKTWFTEPQKLIEGGYVADITDAVKTYEYDKKINSGFLNLTSKDDKIYGIPFNGYGLGLFLNMNLFKEAGLVDGNGIPQYPKTFDELVETAKTITEKTGKAGMYIPTNSNVGGWHFTNLAWNFGAEFEKYENGKWMSNIDSPEVIKALEYIHALKYEHDVLLPDALLAWAEWVQNYGTDNVGMVFAASDAVNAPVTGYSMDKDAIAIAPMPEGPGGQYALTGGNVFMFSSDATPEEIDACIKFLEITGHSPKTTDELKAAWDDSYSTKKENGEVVGPQNIQVWIDEERVQAEKEIVDQYTNVNMALFDDYYKVTPGILKAEEPVLTQELYSILDEVIQGVLADKNADIPAIVKNADQKFQKEYLDALE